MASTPRETAYLVFAQAADDHVDVPAWDAHASRFFDTRLAAATSARLLVTPASGAPGERRVEVRPREAEDLALAEAADASGTGLAMLARRCPRVWLVPREADADAIALRLAAILASVLLGPILDARGPELFGVKTARAKLAAMEWAAQN